MSIDGYAHVMTDMCGVFLSVDDRYCEILGRERREILGRSSKEFTAIADQIATVAAVNSLRQGSEPLVFRKRYARPDRSLILIENHASVISDGLGENRMIGSIRVLPSCELPEKMEALCQVARSIQGESEIRRNVFGTEESTSRRWSLLLACYILEVERNDRTGAVICGSAGMSEREGSPLLEELVRRGDLDIERTAPAPGNSLFRLSAEAHRKFAQYFEWLWDWDRYPGVSR